MKKTSLLSIVLLFSVIVPSAFAATSEVTWTNPEEYRDIHHGENHRKKFQARVFRGFEEHFAKLASSLPEGQTLKVEVTDVDLAGDVFVSHRQVRVVKEIYFPRLKFKYQVIDKDGNEVKQGEENLKDMNFMMTSSLKYNNDFLRYEKRLLDNWFKKTF